MPQKYTKADGKQHPKSKVGQEFFQSSIDCSHKYRFLWLASKYFAVLGIVFGERNDVNLKQRVANIKSVKYI